jgi:carbamoyl-phosphate synthase large subunit
LVATFIDPESEILSKHRAEFAAIGVELLVSYEETAHLCFDKFEM